jgi:eukaryotic-like serine/threonine-protein kinase
VTVELEDTALPPSDPARTKTLDAQESRAPETDGLPAGIHLGHFRIDRKLGAGGMGEVYLATDLALDRPVAVKVLPSHTGGGAARERLVREARAQARVQHPNVAHIYFIGEDAGRLYFAMEYIAGTTLADRIAKGPLPVEEALAMIRAAVLGLREAQRSGFTHRDVKPSNLMVDAHGMLKVLDFGLVAASPEHSDGPVEQTTLAGTPLYMAPEQARGEPIDLRADIYALGATLYHLVSGKPPFEAPTVAELISMHASAERPAVPRGANPRVAVTALDTLIQRMMAPSPADRFASYDELLRAIDSASTQHTRPAGFWVRSIASLVDLLLVGVIYGVIRIIPFGRSGAVGLDEVSPVALAYGTLALARWGTTAGKALFELEVVDVVTGGRPSWGRAFERELLLLILPALAQLSIRIWHIDAIVLLAANVILLASLAHAAARVPGKRTPWDRLARTQVRYRVLR